jgi:hypothetical protein
MSKQATMQSRLGLQQTPKPAGAAPRVRATPKTAPKREGLLWGSVQVLTEHATSPGLQCLNCGAKFATRIREHVTGLGALTGCTCETESFLEFKQKQIDEAAKSAGAKKQKIAEGEVDHIVAKPATERDY